MMAVRERMMAATWRCRLHLRSEPFPGQNLGFHLLENLQSRICAQHSQKCLCCTQNFVIALSTEQLRAQY